MTTMPSDMPTEPPVAQPKRSIRALLYRRLKLVKYTPFGTYYKIRSEDYELDHRGQTILDYNFQSVEASWKSLPREAQEKYRELTRLENELVDIEKRKIDKEIIALRPRKRAYTGYTISRRVSQKDSSDLDQIAFNHVEWYHQHMLAQLVGTPRERSWFANYQAHLAEAYRNCPLLPDKQKQIYIHRAKMEYRNSNKRRSRGDEIVDAVLAKGLGKTPG